MKKSSLYYELFFDPARPQITTLFETPFTKEIRITLHKGTTMKEHKTAFPIVIEMIDGAVDFGVNNEVILIKKGDLIALESNVPHNLRAQENTIIRLTLTKSDLTSRVEKAANL